MVRGACLLVVFCALAPARARAWTDAAVRSVDARVVVARDGTAHVTIVATVRVHGGWLEGVELAGFDPDLALDESAPPWASDEANERYEPRVRLLPGGRVQLSFPHRSPRRGRVRVGIAYRTTLAHRATEPLADEGRVRVRWTLPGWRAGLDGVVVSIVAPRGSRPARSEDASVDAAVSELPEGTLIAFRRPHLPRTLAWTVAVDVPTDAMIAELRAPAIVRPAPRAHRRARAHRHDPRLFWIALAALVAIVAVGKIVSVRRLARRSRSAARPLLPGPIYLRMPVLVALCGAAAWIGAADPSRALLLLAAASLCATFRPGQRRAASHLGAFVPVDARWLRTIRRARIAAQLSLFDATSALGAVHLAGWVALPWVWHHAWVDFDVLLCASVLPLPILLSGTRRAFARAPLDALQALLAFARRLRDLPPGVALRPVLHLDARGALQDARLRVLLAQRPRGLLRFDLALAEARRAGGYERTLVLLVVTRAGSAAERALSERLCAGTPSPGGRRVLRTFPIDPSPLARILAELADCPPAPEAARGIALAQETVRELPPPNAVGF